MTATQPDGGMTRRGVMRRTAIGVGAAATLGATATGSASAIEFPSKAEVLTAAGVLISPVGVLAYGAYKNYRDNQVADALTYQSHVNEYTRSLEEKVSRDQFEASLKRDIQLIPNKAREQAIFRIYEQGVDGGDTASATTAAENAINDAFAAVEKAILQRWNVQTARVGSLATLFSNSSQWGDVHASGSHPLKLADDGSVPAAGDVTLTPVNFTEKTHNLYNGDPVGYQQWYNSGGGSFNGNDNEAVVFDPLRSEYGAEEYDANEVRFRRPDSADYSVSETNNISEPYVTILDVKETKSLLSDLQAEYDVVIGEVSQMVDSYFGPAQNGEIDLTDAVGPAYLTDTAANATNLEEAALALRGMGFPLAKTITEVNLKQNDGSETRVPARLSWTAHNGNTLPVGTEIQPDSTVGSIYAAVQFVDDSGNETGEVIELTKPFTIVSAKSGADTIAFEDRTIVTNDSSLTNEEIQTLFKENRETNEKAKEFVYNETTSGGGGGFLSGGSSDVRTLGIVAGGAALAALLFGNN